MERGAQGERCEFEAVETPDRRELRFLDAPLNRPAFALAARLSSNSYYYWSTTTDAGSVGYPDYAWGVFFGDGFVESEDKTYGGNYSGYVRAVRSGS